MPQELPTIYRAKNLQEAQLLCNILEEEGIRATVTNGVLENGSGVDILGWPTLARVAVAQKDAVRAREIALEYDQEVSGKIREEEQNSPQAVVEGGVEEAWPCCPECGARRLTHCPFCGTSGTNLPFADANTVDLLGLPTPSAEALSGCSCGPGGCGNHEVKSEGGQSIADENDTETHDESAESPEASSAPLLLCPTCDEPFDPQYLRRCEWCGHEFPDGMETLAKAERVQEPFNWRIGYVIYLLALLAFGLALYLLWLF